jgi:hypothetical protein
MKGASFTVCCSKWLCRTDTFGVTLHKTGGKTKNKMRGRRPEGHIEDPRNNRMEETSRRQKRKEASSEGGQCPERVVAP